MLEHLEGGPVNIRDVTNRVVMARTPQRNYPKGVDALGQSNGVPNLRELVF
ncbi:hypothetical protein OF83DRAFT_1168829, partial [Amylostereum chailletii]